MASPTKQSVRNNPGAALVRMRWLAHRTVHEGQILFWRSLRLHLVRVFQELPTTIVQSHSMAQKLAASLSTFFHTAEWLYVHGLAQV